MATNSNIMRPSILNPDQNLPPPPAASPDIPTLVARLVTDTLRREGRQIINSILNPEADSTNDTDQVIVANQAANLADMDKIPDVVKCLRDFSGQVGEFSSWRKSVERILRIYEPLKGTPKYYGILSVIRNKIVGHADIVLESYNTPLNWEKISKCLILHYADKRDLGTLEYQMTTLVQGNKSIQEFYQSIYQHLSLILNKLSSMEMSAESMKNLTQTYRDKALDTFVRGLKGDLPRLLSIREPIDLPQALHLCLKLANVDFRVQYANNSNASNRRYNAPPPPIPPRRPPAPQSHPMHRKPFYPELYHYPRQNQYPQHQQYQPRQFHNNARPLPPKPLPKPEPMDIDHSIHSRAVNYQNRPKPQFVSQKRFTSQYSNQAHAPRKQQRIFNMEPQSESENDGTNNEQVDEYINQTEQQNNDQILDQTLTDYISYQDNPYDTLEILDDINFLD